MSGIDDQIRKLWEKLPEGSAFREAIERASGFWKEITQGEDPDYRPPEQTPGRSDGSSNPPPGDKRSAGETNPALLRAKAPKDPSPRRI